MANWWTWFSPSLRQPLAPLQNANSDKMMGKKKRKFRTRKTSQVCSLLMALVMKCWFASCRREGFELLTKKRKKNGIEVSMYPKHQCFVACSQCSCLNFMRDLISVHCVPVRSLFVSPSIRMNARQARSHFHTSWQYHECVTRRKNTQQSCYFICAHLFNRFGFISK